MRYRREIDGLRAVAVIPVMLYHAGFAWCGGGYVGVDIFFVISGYLITSIIVDEQSRGNFTIVGFYERRVRRILPGLFVVVTACIIPAWLWMSPQQLLDFARSVAAVNLFVSNMLFWRSTGYFSPDVELMPLIHTWSLAVEEQYYLVFPLLIIACWKLQRRWLIAIIVFVAFGSLIGSEWGWRNRPTANFFLAPFRAWELFVGALLAIHMFGNEGEAHAPRWLKQFLSSVGAFLILMSVLRFSDSTPCPSIYTLMPCGGALLIIAFGEESTFVGRLLAQPVFVGTGLISYSAYLWHQPLLAFARLRSINEPSVILKGALMGAALLLAYATWRYVEIPFRVRSFIPRARIFVLSLVFSAFLIGLAYAGIKYQGVPERYAPDTLALLQPPRTHLGCTWTRLGESRALDQCALGSVGVGPSIILYGDSHADALAGALDERLRVLGKAGLYIYNRKCVQPFGIYDGSDRNATYVATCSKAHRELLQFISESPNIRAILLANRWTLKMYPAKGEVDVLAYDNGEGGRESIRYREYFALNSLGAFDTSADAKRVAIQAYIRNFAATGRKIIVQYPVPEVGWHVPYQAFKLRQYAGLRSATISTSHERFRLRNRLAYVVLDGLRDENIVRITPEEVLCDAAIPGRCVADLDGTLLYFDDNHLSNTGASLVVAQAMQYID